MKFAFVAALLFSSVNLSAQDSVLTLTRAMDIALQNNYDIRIATNTREQADNNNTAGNAGMLPNVDLDASYNNASNSLSQRYNTGAEVERDASTATGTVVDLGAEWLVFDGLRMFSTKKRLNELSLQAQDQLRIQIETSLQGVIEEYYSMVRNIQLLKAMNEEIHLSEERVKIADRKMSNGSGSRLEWLQAKTEYNRQLALQIALNSSSEEARIRLNRLLGRSIETGFSVEDTVVIDYKPVFEDLKKTVAEQNNFLSYYKRNERIALYGLKENQALRFPWITLNSHYIYSKTTNDAGLILLNQSQGLTFGATATIPLFHGFNINRVIRNSKLDVRNASITLESANAQVSADLFNAWREFTNSLELLGMEEQNIGYAREVLHVAQERYRVGVSNILEQQESQRIFEEAMTRLADARYNAKISETNLRRLNSELVRK